jgi:hypothetical protein
MEVCEINYGKSVAVFVALAMPFAFVSNMAKKNTEINLVLMGKYLYPTYSYITDKYLNVHTQVASKFIAKHAICLLSSLIKSRLLKREAFHQPILIRCGH